VSYADPLRVDWTRLASQYHEGDLVEVRKGEEVHRGRLVKRTQINRRTMESRESLGLSVGAALSYYFAYHYDVELIARALPKDPGFYAFGETGLAILDRFGSWYDAADRARAIADPPSFFGKRVPRRLKEVSE
jgi:hypothetical protein